MIWIVVAVVAAGCAAGLAFGPGRLNRLEPRAEGDGRRANRSLPVLALLSGFAIFWATGGLTLLGWCLAAGIVAGTVGWLWWMGRRRTQLAGLRRETARTARVIASQLRIGQVPSAALLEAATDCPELAPVVATVRIGGDPVEALRVLATRPGREGLGDVADAWRLSAASGAPIADVIDQVAERLRDDEATLAIVTSELAAPRATGRTLACLPLLGLAMGFFAGGNPLAFIATSAIGQWLFVMGVALAAVGVWWIEHLADSVQ